MDRRELEKNIRACICSQCCEGELERGEKVLQEDFRKRRQDQKQELGKGRMKGKKPFPFI